MTAKTNHRSEYDALYQILSLCLFEIRCQFDINHLRSHGEIITLFFFLVFGNKRVWITAKLTQSDILQTIKVMENPLVR